MVAHIIDITGQRFGRLVVAELLEKRGKGGAVYFLCKCDCGNQCARVGSKLKNNGGGSCGCLQKEIASRHNTIHGHTAPKTSPTYRSWLNMKQRILNPKHHKFKEYGGRGLTIDQRWLVFKNFLADMGERPIGTTIHRKNNDVGYNKENCCWATSVEQNRQRRGVTYQSR